MQAEFDALKSNVIPSGHGAIVQGQSSGSTGMPVERIKRLFACPTSVRCR